MHGLDLEQCDLCSGAQNPKRGASTGSMAGKSFALIYAPAIREDTFLHLNREGDHWKIRWYSSPSKPATELAQSGAASTRRVIDLASANIVEEIAYPYSTGTGGVSVKDSRYWFDEIQKANAQHGISRI